MWNWLGISDAKETQELQQTVKSVNNDLTIAKTDLAKTQSLQVQAQNELQGLKNDLQITTYVGLGIMIPLVAIMVYKGMESWIAYGKTKFSKIKIKSRKIDLPTEESQLEDIEILQEAPVSKGKPKAVPAGA